MTITDLVGVLKPGKVLNDYHVSFTPVKYGRVYTITIGGEA